MTRLKIAVGCLLWLLGASALAGTHQGVGDSYDEALRAAFANALSASGIAFVDTSLIIDNGELTSETIEVISKGVIKSYQVVDVVAADQYTVTIDTSLPKGLKRHQNAAPTAAALSLEEFNDAILTQQKVSQVNQSLQSLIGGGKQWLETYYQFQFEKLDIVLTQKDYVKASALIRLSIDPDLKNTYLEYLLALSQETKGDRVPVAPFYIEYLTGNTFTNIKRGLELTVPRDYVSSLPPVIKTELSVLGTTSTLFLYDNLAVFDGPREVPSFMTEYDVTPRLDKRHFSLRNYNDSGFKYLESPIHPDTQKRLDETRCYFSPESTTIFNQIDQCASLIDDQGIMIAIPVTIGTQELYEFTKTNPDVMVRFKNSYPQYAYF